MKLDQKEILDIITKYNTIDRTIIKDNLKQIKEREGFTQTDIITKFNFKTEKVRAWFNRASDNIPTFQDMLLLANTYGFDIRETINKQGGLN